MLDSMKLKRKRVTALILAGTLLAFCFCGCKKDDIPEETTTANTPETTEAISAIETIAPTIPLEEPLFTGTVTAGELNVREGIGVNYDVVKKLSNGDSVEIYETGDLNGVPWGRTIDGWLCLAYVDFDEGEYVLNNIPTNPPYEITEPITGVVIATELNIRSGPGTNYKVTRTVKEGQQLTITELDGNWGKTEAGWVNTFFVYFKDSMDAASVSAVVTSDGLNVRSGPGTGYESLEKLNSGDEVTILKQVTVRDVRWGYIGDGWICLDYVRGTDNN